MRRFVALVSLLAALAVSALPSAAAPAPAETSSGWVGEAEDWFDRPRADVPEDRYAMAGGCYTMQAPDGSFVTATGDGYALGAAENAEPLHFQATELGMYLLYDARARFVAAGEGALGEAAYAASGSAAGGYASSVTGERSDQAADTVADSPANRAAGRGSSVVAADGASRLADWVVEAGGSGFTFSLPKTDQVLVAREGGLDLAGSDPTAFSLRAAQGCAAFPEVEVNVEGPVVGGQTSFQEVRGHVDAHLHMMAFEFLGGRARCGRPWHRYGVTHALVDCPDHAPGGHGALLEAVVSRGTPLVDSHEPEGWPSFAGWPRYNSLTHEQVYYKWLERAWRGGLRLFTNLLVDNTALCKIYPYKKNSCNEMDGVELQWKRIHEFENYVDAQYGGPGEGWFRIVDDPFEARRVINEGKLAVVLGVEVSVPLDCGLAPSYPKCDTEHVVAGVDRLWDMGVRQMELVNKFDNQFSGVAGDGGTTGMVVNQGNLLEAGHYWKMDTCPDDHGHAHDRTQMNFHDQSGSPDQFTGRDALAGGILALAGTSGAAPVYPEGPHCNQLGLSELGVAMIKAMVAKGMIFDPDHMSAKAQTEALNLLSGLGYSGVISSHGWSNDTIYPRIYNLGGFVTPYAGSSASFAGEWEKHVQWKDPRFYFGFGYGADANGFGAQGEPRRGENPVTYPFTGFGGVTIHEQVSGTREPYHVNQDGVAHYGLYPDWIEDLRKQKGDAIVADMERGAEAYLQMWERAMGVGGDACRSDIDDLSPGAVRSIKKGTDERAVIDRLGQPNTRTPAGYTFCTTQGTATVSLDGAGKVSGVSISKSK